MSEPTRKLAAIVFTDIVGFTKLTADDQSKASNLLKQQRKLLKPIVESFNGSWVKEIGDGLLLIFDTVTDAVNCSIKIQKEAKRIDSLLLRIGIHQGEILLDENDVIGDDVNVASRIEPFSAPGGVAISNKVNDALVRESAFETKYLGKPKLKGVGQEVKVYCITSHGLPETKLSDVTAKLENRSSLAKYFIFAAIVTVLLAGYLYMTISDANKIDKLSIAVLPFTNISSDEDNEYFSDGLTEELLNSLAQIDSLKITARTSSFTFKGKTDDIKEIGKQLSVANVLKGSVRKFGNDIRITTQLIRVNDGVHIWSETYDRKFKDIFKIQKEISDGIASILKLKLLGDGLNQRRGITDNPEALNLYLKGKYFWNKKKEKELYESIEYFKKALVEDPNYALSWVGIAEAWLELITVKRFTISGQVRTNFLGEARQAVDMALRIDSNIGEAYTVLGRIHRNNKELANSYFEKSIQLNTEYAEVHHFYGEFLASSGLDTAQSIRELMTAIEIDPLSPSILATIGDYYYRYKNESKLALKYLQTAFEIDPFFVYGNKNWIYTSLLEKYYKWEEAEASWKYAYQTDSTQFGTLFGISNYYMMVGDIENSIFYYEKLYKAFSSRKSFLDLEFATDIYNLSANIELFLKHDLNSSTQFLEKSQIGCYIYDLHYLIYNYKANLNKSNFNKIVNEIFYNVKVNCSDNDNTDEYGSLEKGEFIFNMINSNENDYGKIVKQFSESQYFNASIVGFGYAIVGKKDKALEYLEIAVNNNNLGKSIRHPVYRDYQADPAFINILNKMDLSN